ncbi:MAG: decaprenyl-phosphate phosphoribosyltransferase [Vicinamibacterales bacterium]
MKPSTRFPRPSRASRRSGLVAALRPHQWTKNLIVFAGLIFGQKLLDPRAASRAAAAFAIFCALSSVVYLLNDLADVEADRLHPLKKHRAIASGAVAPALAATTAAVLAGVGLTGAFLLGRYVGIVALGYLALLALYSGPLKQLVIIDVLTIAGGFVLRAVAGAVAIPVPISPWLLIDTILLALFLGLAKRRHELVLLADEASGHRRSLGDYSPYLLDQMIAVVSASTIVAYAFYTVNPDTIQRFGTNMLGLTLPFPLYGIFRYLYLVHRKEGGGSPADLLLTDQPLLICVVLWAAAVVALIYGVP